MRFLLILVLLALPASAQEMPEYEGVYVRMTSGELIPLSENSNAPEIMFISGRNFYGYTPRRGVREWLLVSARIIDADEIASIVVNSRDGELNYFGTIATAATYYRGELAVQGQPEGWQNYYFEAHWGQNNTLRRRNIDAFNSEYPLEEYEFFQWERMTDSELTPRLQGGYPIAGFWLRLSNGRTYVMVTDVQAEAGLRPLLSQYGEPIEDH